MERPYVPISCTVHDNLLDLATRGEACELVIERGPEGPEHVRGVIVDVYSRGGAEYLELRDGATFRLDEIRALNGRPVPPA